MAVRPHGVGNGLHDYVSETYATIMKSLSRLGLLASLVALALAGCASSHDRLKSADAEVKRHVERGYLPAQRHTTISARDTWTIGPDTVGVSLLVPSEDETYPLVVYMPGLGESADAGLAWRRTWAEAGYVVLSFQPSTLGEAVCPRSWRGRGTS